MSILKHPLFPAVEPFFNIQVYDRDGGHANPRIRIELHPMPAALETQALAAIMPCVACGEDIHPFRRRGPAKRGNVAEHLYYAATCPLDENIGCSRSGPARDEYAKVRRHFGK